MKHENDCSLDFEFLVTNSFDDKIAGHPGSAGGGHLPGGRIDYRDVDPRVMMEFILLEPECNLLMIARNAESFARDEDIPLIIAINTLLDLYSMHSARRRQE